MNAGALERYACRIIEGNLAGFETDEAAEEAEAVLAELDRTDLPERAEVRPYVNAILEKHAAAQVLTAGGREVWHESTHCWTDPPSTLDSEQVRLIRDALREVQHSGKPRQIRL